MQKPTIGRVLHFFPGREDALHRLGRLPLAAIVVAVWSDSCVNLVVFDGNGTSHGRTSVQLVHEEGYEPAGGHAAGYAHWPAREVLPVLLDTASPVPPLPELNDEATELAIKTAGADAAPRVTLADLKSNIATTEFVKYVAPSGQVLRWAVLTTLSGYAVAGRPSVAVSPENDNAELGEKIARDNAVNELWPLMGYELKARLASPTDAMVQRFLQWPVPAHIHPDGTPGQPGRTGTNLLDAVAARGMLAHVLGR